MSLSTQNHDHCWNYSFIGHFSASWPCKNDAPLTQNSLGCPYNDGKTPRLPAEFFHSKWSISFFISSRVFPVWVAHWRFYNSCYLVLFCLDLFRGGGAAAAAAKMVITLASSPQIPRSLLSFLPVLSAQQSGRTSLVSCHTSRAGSGFSHGAYTCANCLTLCLFHPEASLEKSLTGVCSKKMLSFFCFVFIVSVPIFTWPNTEKHCCTGAFGDPQVSCCSCSLFLLGFSCNT